MTDEIRAKLEERFENLASSGYEIKSPKTRIYNCFGWAMGDVHRPWYPPEGNGQHWPLDEDAEHWPDGVYAAPLLSLFAQAFETRGYTLCESPEHESGTEKVAIYGYPKTEIARHAARQLPNGVWTSKIGGSVDIEHDGLESLEGAYYGKAMKFMERAAQAPPDPPPLPKIVLPDDVG